MSPVDSFTPTYESAIARDPWSIVAPYVTSKHTLASAVLVSRQCNAIFMPLLWGNPTAYAHDSSLGSFLRALPSARLCSRELVRALQLSWLESSVVDCFDTWIQALLLLLPNLQSLYVSGLACLDHRSLRSVSLLARKKEDDLQFNLRLLEAKQAENLTPSALVEAIPQFPRLVYLDVSGTSSARDHAFLSTLSALRELKLLKLSGAGLKDADLEVMVHALRRRVRFLDISQNKLTDRGLRVLQRYCFRESGSDATVKVPNNHYFEWSASSAPFSNILTSASLVSERFEKDLRQQLGEPLTGRSNFTDIPWTGISHLVLGGNNITPDCLGNLIVAGRLRYLDAGSLTLPPGFLKHPGAQNLRFLRVHHSSVTQACQTAAQQHDLCNSSVHLPASPSIVTLLEKRPFLDDYDIGPALLHPSWLPSLETLVLTDLPKKVRQSSGLASQLIRYITACGNEAYLANVSAPSYVDQSVSSLQFALRRIVLETTPHSTSTRVSATEDEDSENLWKEAADDFSFFRNEAVSKYKRGEATPEPLIDTISTLAAFRRAKRSEHLQALNHNGCYVEGYWNGEVTVAHR